MSELLFYDSRFSYGSFQPGDIVAVRHGMYGRKEGLVIGSHIDYAVSGHTALFSNVD